jgi:peptide/nickel transport system substrate-binding protein
LPKHRLEGKTLDNVAPEDLIGTGPLVLEDWQDDTVTLRRNAEYWDGAPWINEWTYRAYADGEAGQTALESGSVDVLAGALVPSAQSLTSVAANEFYALVINLKRAPFDDQRVREALAHALDRTTLARSGTPPSFPIETSLLPAFWALQHAASPPTYDSERALQLLTDAGWSDSDGDSILDKEGKPLEVTLWAQADGPYSERTALLVREQLAKVGIRPVLKLDDRILFWTRMFLQEYDLAIAHFNIPLDPDQRYFWASSEDEPGFGLNLTGLSKSQVDLALEAGARTPRCDADARAEAYAPVFETIDHEIPMIFLFAPPLAVSAENSVSGIQPSSFAGPFWNLNQWGVSR